MVVVLPQTKYDTAAKRVWFFFGCFVLFFGRRMNVLTDSCCEIDQTITFEKMLELKFFFFFLLFTFLADRTAAKV